MFSALRAVEMLNDSALYKFTIAKWHWHSK